MQPEAAEAYFGEAGDEGRDVPVGGLRDGAEVGREGEDAIGVGEAAEGALP